MKLDPDASERRLRRTAWLAVVLLSILALAWGARVSASVAAGGILSAANLEGLVRLVHVLTAPSLPARSWLTIIGVGLRYLLLGIGLFVIVGVWHANVVALSVGLSAPVAAVFLEWGLESMREFRSR